MQVFEYFAWQFAKLPSPVGADEFRRAYDEKVGRTSGDLLFERQSVGAFGAHLGEDFDRVPEASGRAKGKLDAVDGEHDIGGHPFGSGRPDGVE